MSIENAPKGAFSTASESNSRDILLAAIAVAQSHGFEATTEALISLLHELQNQFGIEDQAAAHS